jgi:hypothetical protein
MQPLSQVSEREERRALQWSMNLSKCQEKLSQPGHGVFILPLPVTSRYVKNVYLADCPRLNSNGKNTKSTTVKGARWARRTVRLGPAERLPGPPELHTVLSGFEVKNGPSA